MGLTEGMKTVKKKGRKKRLSHSATRSNKVQTNKKSGRTFALASDDDGSATS